MSRRLIVVASVIAVVGAAGFLAVGYVTDSTASQEFAVYSPPAFDKHVTDDQRIWALQNDLGSAAGEMAQLREMATKLQFGKMKAMGDHLQEVADDLQPRLDDIEDKKAKAILARGIEGLRIVGQGSAELDPDKSMRGVNQVLESLDTMRQLQES